MDSRIAEWYAIRTKSRHEQKVYDELVSLGIDCFHPTIEVLSRRKDRKKKIRSTLFPGYLFIKCILTDDNWYSINNIRGVAGIVGTFENATPIPEEQIATINLLLDSGLPVNPYPYLNEGERVVVKAGSLKGTTGIYIRPDDKQSKLVVSLDLLGRSIVVEIDPCLIDKD